MCESWFMLRVEYKGEREERGVTEKSQFKQFLKTKTHHHIFSQKYCQWFSYSLYLKFFISKYFSLKSLSIIIFLPHPYSKVIKSARTCMLKKGWGLYFQEKMYCLTVRITRFLNLNKSLFLYFPNKTDCIWNEICISNILKIHSSVLPIDHLQEDT